MLVEIVLMPAAKIEAISNPVIPVGKAVTMKKGNILSTFSVPWRLVGNNSGIA